MLAEAGLPTDHRGRLAELLGIFQAPVLWAQVQAAAKVHTQVEFAAPAGAQGGARGVIDLVFRVASGWKIVDYQSETAVVAATAAAGARDSGKAGVGHSPTHY